MRLPISNPKAIPPMPTTDDEVAQERAYCEEISRLLLEYECDPRHFLRRSRLSSKLVLS